MRKVIFIFITISTLILSSCKEDKDSVYDSLPSNVVEALNNARLICDSIGYLTETLNNSNYFTVKDNYGNIINIELLGNVDICTYNNVNIHIDNTIKESNITPNDTICHTLWKGFGNPSGLSLHTNKCEDPFLSNNSYGAEFEKTTYTVEHKDTTENLANYYELKFKNTTCILSSWDTLYVQERIVKEKYARIKVKEQEYMVKSTNDIRHYSIEIKNDTAYLYEYEYHNSIDTSNSYYKKLRRSQALDCDGTYNYLEDFEVESSNELTSIANHNCKVFNFKRIENGKICIYNQTDGQFTSELPGEYLRFDFIHVDQNDVFYFETANLVKVKGTH